MSFVAYYDKHPELPFSQYTYTRLNRSRRGSTTIHGLNSDVIETRLHALFTRTQFLPTGEEICHGRHEGYGVRTGFGLDFAASYAN